MCIVERMFSLIPTTGKKEADLARYLGVGTSQLSNWKSRKTDPPAKYIADICKFLSIDPWYLLTGKQEEKSMQLTEQESILLRRLRSLPLDDQEEIHDFIELKYKRQMKKESSTSDDGGKATA